MSLEESTQDPSYKPLMILGEGKTIFKQFVFSKGSWIMANGTKQMMPKDEEQGIMISLFVSQEIEYGYTPSKSILDEVDQSRKIVSFQMRMLQ